MTVNTTINWPNLELLWIHLRLAAITGVAYFFVSHVGLHFVVQPESLAAVWPSSGLALAVLALNSVRMWPSILSGIFIANVYANLTSGSSVLISLGFATANTLEGLVAASILVVFTSTPVRINTWRDVLVLLGMSAGISNAITALVGAAVPTIGFGASFWDVWRVWWIADGLGMIVIAPLVLSWASLDRDELLNWLRQEGLELGLILAALAGITQLIFDIQEQNQEFLLTSPYLTIPFLLLAAYRFKILGAASATLVLATIAVWHTAGGEGPFVLAGRTVTEQVLGVQAFLIVAAAAALIMAVTVMERNRVEDALRRSETHFRRLIEDAPAAILSVDATGHMTLANAQAEGLFGYEIGEMIGQPIEMLLPDHVGQLYKSRHLARLSETGPRSIDIGVDLLGRKKDGLQFPVEVRLNDVITEAGPQTLAYVTDMTERQRMEAQRMELIAERERVEVLQQFITNASHDLKTPLTVLQTNMYLLRRLLNNQKLDAAIERIDTLEEYTHHLTRLVNDMLEMSRLDGTLDITRTPVDLTRLVGNIVGDNQPNAENNQQTLCFELGSVMSNFEGDADLLDRAISNLLTNALNYTPNGGNIKVRVVETDNQIGIEVRDNGIGIDTEFHKQIFERFWRVDSARGLEMGGTGLGLAIAKRIIELHNGHIKIKSQEGKGSTFTIWLPVTA